MKDKINKELLKDVQKLKQENSAELKQAEKALFESEKRIQLLFNNAPLGYQSLDFDGNFLEVNQTWLDLLGYTHDEVIGKWFGDFMPLSSQNQVRKEFSEFIANGEVHTEFEMIHKNGSIIIIAFEGRIAHDLNGEFKQTHCILQFITDHKKWEDAIKKSEAKHSSMISNISDVIGIIGADGLMNYKSSNIEKWFGWLPQDLVGTDGFSNVHPDDLERIQKGFFTVLEKENSSITLEFRYKCKDGSYKPIELTAKNLVNDPIISGVLLNYHDITERKHYEENLQKSERFLQETQVIANLGTYMMDISSGKWLGSEVLEKIFGIDTDYDKSVEGWESIIHPEWQKIMTDYFAQEVIGNKTKFDKEYKIIRKNDGAERWVHGLGNLKFNENDQPITMIGTIQDITERKVAEIELIKAKEKAEESEQLFKSTINSFNEFIHVIDKEHKIVLANDECIKQTQQLNFDTNIIGKYIFKVYPFLNSTILEQYNTVFSSGNELITYEKNIFNEEDFYTETKKTPILNTGKVVRVITTIKNITEQTKAEQELIIAKEKAEESDRLKSAFLANMSHEIRTPMNGILGFSNLLKKPNLSSEKQHRFIDIIEKSGKRMLNTIDSIIDVSKIESGLVQTNIEGANINEKMEFVYNLLKPDAKKKGITFLYKNTLSSEDAFIITDNEKIYGILTNLVKNAIKFTDKGSIEFGYQKKGKYLEFFVKDTGIGIPKDRQAAIFERFIQADIEDKRAFQGSGLGLAISKSYVEMLGGKIWVESEEGLGSTFYFTIPYNLDLQKKIVFEDIVSSDIATENQAKDLKILIAEDEEVAVLLITEAIQEISSEVIHASTGVEAIRICYNNPDLDLVLMDIRMPVMGGYEATSKIRQFNKDIIILAQTAYAQSGDREKAIEAGCNDYISKPIDTNLLYKLIKKHINK
jgi:PAS domain S-box-containing protein